jgi:xanthine dehydrogenase YagR molybdenum-binding subunit
MNAFGRDVVRVDPFWPHTLLAAMAAKHLERPVKLALTRHTSACLLRGAKRFGWSRRWSQPRSMREGRDLIGWGVALALYPGNRMPASARALMRKDGSVIVQAATQDIGTGSYTIFTQIAADALGLPMNRVQFEPCLSG